jgi:glycosyltransferase involved in cell wall biosynthesis
MTEVSTVRLGVVVIGRNEGERLARCLNSLRVIANCVYVDSGSSDGSVALARSAGVSVMELSEPPNFTAARARNVGIAKILSNDPLTEFVQVVDGDCEVQPGWIALALAALRNEPGVALVFGRRRERHPERSIYNALCDQEWNAPIGEATGVGGDAMFRVAALRQVDFYNAAMIAGEDTELAMRLRKCGWRLRRIDAEMTLHDADITRFGQWWHRIRRSGHAYAEMAYLHPDAREPNWPRTVRSIVVWGGLTPAAVLIATTLSLSVDARWWFAVAALLLPWPVNMLRLAHRQRSKGSSARIARASGVMLMVGKLPQFLGLLGYYRDRLLRRASQLIEYKHGESKSI